MSSLGVQVKVACGVNAFQDLPYGVLKGTVRGVSGAVSVGL